jgi:hypothetical protein
MVMRSTIPTESWGTYRIVGLDERVVDGDDLSLAVLDAATGSVSVMSPSEHDALVAGGWLCKCIDAADAHQLRKT